MEALCHRRENRVNALAVGSETGSFFRHSENDVHRSLGDDNFVNT